MQHTSQNTHSWHVEDDDALLTLNVSCWILDLTTCYRHCTTIGQYLAPCRGDLHATLHRLVKQRSLRAPSHRWCSLLEVPSLRLDTPIDLALGSRFEFGFECIMLALTCIWLSCFGTSVWTWLERHCRSVPSQHYLMGGSSLWHHATKSEIGVLFMALMASRASLRIPGGNASQCLICFSRSIVLHCRC